MKKIYTVYLFGLLLFAWMKSSGQICDPSVPLFNVDLTGNPNGTWTSPNVSRTGYCCSASGSDNCVEFVVVLDPAASGISFDIISGAVPGGALFYQVNCGTPAALGTPICLTGVGPHYITFCKPGNNNNVYQIQSFPQPSAGGTQWVSQACTGMLGTAGLDEPTITWTSIPANPVYNSFLSCTSGCDTVYVVPSGTITPFADYQVCGTVSGACGMVSFCDTLRIYFVNTLAVNITPQNPTICFGGTSATVTAQPSGGLFPFSYLWSTGATTQSVTVGVGTYTVQMTDAMNCMTVTDTVVINAFTSFISANAGADQLMCNGAVVSVGLNGSITAASGGVWMGGSGNFNPDNTAMNALYTPSGSEISGGSAQLMLVTTGNAGCPPDTDHVLITIAPQPAPVLTGQSNLCRYSSEFYIASNSTLVTYSWGVTGGTILGNYGDSILVNWHSPGAGSVMLTASNTAGCDTSLSIPVTIHPQPVPVLTGATSACTPMTEVYHVTNAMNDNVTWNVSGGVISGSSIADSIVVQWQNSGTGTVTVTLTGSAGCDSTLVLNVALSSTPVTSVSGLQTLCGSETATYSASASNAVSFNWLASGGTIISNSGSSIDVLWNSTGAHNVTLTAANSAGCETTISYAVNVYPKPVPSIAGSLSICTPLSSIYYTANAMGRQVSWTISGGTIVGPANADSVIVQWNAIGIATVSVTLMNGFGCDSTVSIAVSLSPTPVLSVTGQQNICGSAIATYTATPSVATSFDWTVSGGAIQVNNESSVDVLWTTIGTGSVTLTATSASGCDTILVYTVNVHPVPAPVISGSAAACIPVTNIYYVSNPLSDNVAWSVTGGVISGSTVADSVVVQWNTTGTGTVSVFLLSSQGCDSSATIAVALSATPVTSISGLQEVCGPAEASYTAAASNAVSFNWAVDGGTIAGSNGSSIDVTWTTIGAGSITLTAVNASGCDTTIIYPVNINPQPAPSISGPVAVCLPAASVYRVSSPGQNNYAWTVTEGTIIGSPYADSITVQWNVISGTGMVSVQAANSFGCDSTVAINVALSVTPSPYITGSPSLCGAQSAPYFVSPSNAVQYNWQVSGGSVISSNGDSVLVGWNAVGTGSIVLTATNAEGCDTTLYFTTSVYPVPTPIVTGPAEVCAPATYAYSVPGVAGDSYSWNVSGGIINGSAGSDNVSVNWMAVGTGLLTLVQTNSYGCDTTISMNIILNANPTPSITGNSTNCLHDTSTYSVTEVQGHTYNWSVTGGTIISFTVHNSIDVYWYNPGAGTVSIIQSAPEGCQAPDVKNVFVNPLPTPAIIGPSVVCLNDQQGYSADPQSGSTYLWSVTGGNFQGSNSQPDAGINWNVPGQGLLSMTETDLNGCIAQISNQVLVNPLPDAGINGSQVGCVDPYGSTYMANPASATIYQWSMTGGAVSSGNGSSVVQVHWNNTGIHVVNLVVTSMLTGCENISTLQVVVDSMPPPAITGSHLNGCSPLTASLTANPLSPDYSYQWEFGDGTGSLEASPSHLFTIPGSYVITLIASNNSGCRDTVHSGVNVFNAPLASFDLQVADNFYPEEITTFSVLNNSFGASLYQWDFGDGTTSGQYAPQHQYAEPGSYEVTLIVSNLYGCRDSMRTSVEIRVPEDLYVPDAFTPNGDSHNDVFSVTARNISDLHILIFNRWGHVIFDSNDKDFAWDGYFNGSYVQEGVYVYKLDAIGYHGQHFRKVGTVSVLR